MPRLARVVVPGHPHHITQRGNRRQPILFCGEDYGAYLDLMAHWCAELDVQVWAYCLMPNHVHLIAVPGSENGLRRAIGEAHRRYTRRGERTGRPAGSDAFVAGLGRLTRRRPQRREPGAEAY